MWYHWVWTDGASGEATWRQSSSTHQQTSSSEGTQDPAKKLAQGPERVGAAWGQGVPPPELLHLATQYARSVGLHSRATPWPLGTMGEARKWFEQVHVGMHSLCMEIISGGRVSARNALPFCWAALSNGVLTCRRVKSPDFVYWYSNIRKISRGKLYSNTIWWHHLFECHSVLRCGNGWD